MGCADAMDFSSFLPYVVRLIVVLFSLAFSIISDFYNYYFPGIKHCSWKFAKQNNEP